MSDATEKPKPPTLRSHQPITKVKTLQELFDHPQLRAGMEKVLPRHMNPERMVRTLINATLKTPGLQKVSPLSMLGAAMTIGYLGLEPNTPLQHIHLIPFDVNKWNPQTRKREYVRTDITPIIGYQGYVELIARGERVKDIDCQLIWPGDEWENERGSNRHFRHVEKFAPRKEGQEPLFAYMHARLPGGGEHVEMMTMADIALIRSRSQGYRAAMTAFDFATKDGKKPGSAYTEAPWIKWPLPMIRKTPLRIGQKWLPKSAELATAISLDEAGDEGRVRFENVLDAEAVSEGTWEVPAEEEELPPVEETRPAQTPRSQAATTTVAQRDAPKEEAPADKPKRAPAAKKQAAAAQPEDGPPDDDRFGPAAGADWEPPRVAAPAAAKETTPPPREAASPVTAPQAPAFDEWLLDENGEPVGDDSWTDPTMFASRLEATWLNSNPLIQEALLQQNADAMDAAAVISPAARVIVASLRNPKEPAPIAQQDERQEDPGAPDEEEIVPLVPLAVDRSGKQNVGQYLKDWKAVVSTLSAEIYLPFIAENHPTMMTVPLSTRSLLIKALLERARAHGIDPPAALAESMQAQPPKASPAAATAPAVDPAAADLAKDMHALKNRIADLHDTKTVHEAEAWGRSSAVVTFAARLRHEGKVHLVEEMGEAFEAHKAALKAAAARPPA